MKSRTLLGGVAAGIAFFLWGFLYWAASPLSKQIISPVPGGDAVIAALQTAGATSGAYIAPSREEMEKPENWNQPYISILIYRTGHGVSMPVAIGRGLGISILLGLLLAGFASCMAPRGRGFGGKVMFCVMMGLIFALAGPLVDWNWFSWPNYLLFFRVLDIVGGFTIMGLVTAAIVRPCGHKDCRPGSIAAEKQI